MIIRKSVGVLEDLNGCPVFSLVGDMEFIFNSVKQSVKSFLDDEKSKSLQMVVENGNVVLTRHYLSDIHDNDPVNNYSLAVDKKIIF